jgi:hypothetical protein
VRRFIGAFDWASAFGVTIAAPKRTHSKRFAKEFRFLLVNTAVLPVNKGA